MISALFRTNNPFLAWGATLVLVIALLTLSAFTEGDATSVVGGNRLFEALNRLPTFAKLLMNLICVLSPALLLNELIKSLKISRDAHNLFALAYVVSAFSFLEWTSFNPALLAGACFALILRNLMIVSNSPRQLQLLFDAGLVASICFQFYKPAIVLFPVTLFGILLGGVFRFRALVVWLLGYITPIYLAAAWLYLTNQWSQIYDIVHFDLLLSNSVHFLNTGQKVAISILLVMLAFGFLMSFSAANLKTNSLRNTQRLFSILFVCGVLSVVFLPGDHLFLMSLFVPVAAFFVGRFLESIGPGWMLDLLIVGWLGSLLWGAGFF